jgi:tripartite-type tricarboxylate transporter receptor subunit TctC
MREPTAASLRLPTIRPLAQQRLPQGSLTNVRILALSTFLIAAGQVSQDTASGVTHAMMTSIAVTNAVVQSGHVRRFPTLPDVTSLSETMPDFVMDGFFAIVAPTGTPQPILLKLNQEIGEYLKGAAIQERMRAVGLATDRAGTPESTARNIRAEQDQWRAIGKELGV